jgi:hypothetical protein
MAYLDRVFCLKKKCLNAHNHRRGHHFGQLHAYPSTSSQNTTKHPPQRYPCEKGSHHSTSVTARQRQQQIHMRATQNLSHANSPTLSNTTCQHICAHFHICPLTGLLSCIHMLHTHVLSHTHTHTHTCAFSHTHALSLSHACASTYHVHLHISMYFHSHAHGLSHIHACTHTHTHTHV